MAETFLEVTTIGPDVPPGCFMVEVHSVFRAALNLQPSGGGNLITLLSRELSDYPQSIRLTTAEDFTTYPLEPGTTGRFHDGGIVLGTLHLSFARAERLQADPLPNISYLGQTWRAGVDLLGRMQDVADADLRILSLVDGTSTQTPLGTQLTQAALGLGHAAKSGTMDSARSSVSRLVGLGSGLTPSGDDFLCGFITAAHCRLGRHPDQFQPLRELKLAVLESLSNTNAISATFLRCAIEGRVCRALHDVAEALHNGTQLRTSMVKLCTFGHSSGMDITTGFLYGLAVLE